VLAFQPTPLVDPLIRSAGVAVPLIALVIRALSLLVAASPWLTGGRTKSWCVALEGLNAPVQSVFAKYWPPLLVSAPDTPTLAGPQSLVLVDPSTVLPPAIDPEWTSALESMTRVVCDCTPAEPKAAWPLADLAITSTRRVTPLKVPVETTSTVPLPWQAFRPVDGQTW